MLRMALQAAGLATLLLSSGYLAFAETAVFPPTCAARDVKVITLIEERGEVDDAVQEKLAEAGRAMLQARCYCYTGRVSEAVMLYDQILALGPALARRTQ